MCAVGEAGAKFANLPRSREQQLRVVVGAVREIAMPVSIHSFGLLSPSSFLQDRLPPFLPLHTPMEVRSLATMKKRRLVFEKVLGAGGQGIVFLVNVVCQPREFIRGSASPECAAGPPRSGPCSELPATRTRKQNRTAF